MPYSEHSFAWTVLGIGGAVDEVRANEKLTIETLPSRSHSMQKAISARTLIMTVINTPKPLPILGSSGQGTGPPIDLPAIESKLRGVIEGEVRFADGDKAMYASDAGNYRMPPLGVVLPKNADDVVRTLEICRAFSLPIVARGGGTGIPGQTVNTAVLLDFSKYMNRILDMRPSEHWAVVEPGIVLDTLRDEANRYGLTFGPDPATHSRCTLGGMIGNNSCGIHSVMGVKRSTTSKASRS